MTKHRILLGVTGCIAAYKSCEIIRQLQKADCDVSVVMTEHATKFIGIDTFSALTGSRVAVDNFGCDRDPIPHIRASEACDLFLIAPCTANMIGKIAHGIADDLVSTTALAAHDKLMVAPAMNVHMYEAPSMQDNLQILTRRGVAIVTPGSGYLACGDVGQGRLAEVDHIVRAVLNALEETSQATVPQDMAGQKVLISAGPTHEYLDPVRYISNPSSGKMGYAIAKAAHARGADVCIVSGPVSLEPPCGIRVIPVTSAQEMMDACAQEFPCVDTAIFCAAVSDMRPKTIYSHKLKKGQDSCALSTLELVENPDILATLAATKRPDQCVIGFAAETENVVGNAQTKLSAKGADLIVANEVGSHTGFGQDTNRAFLIDRAGTEELPEMTKDDLAQRILDKACEFRGVC